MYIIIEVVVPKVDIFGVQVIVIVIIFIIV